MSAAAVEVDKTVAVESGPAMIKVDNLRKFYGSFEALKGISFEVGRGEIVGFLGPNGAKHEINSSERTNYSLSDGTKQNSVRSIVFEL